jgi:glycosyltransferase involved in cell wall biosynthesis
MHPNDGAETLPSISVIIPAFNEEGYLSQTIEHLRSAEQLLKSVSDSAVEIVVVDNDSTDRTGAVALELGAKVVAESEHNIGRVRNAGARAAAHKVLVFIDADTLVPRELLVRIARLMHHTECVGGAVEVRFRSRRRMVRAYVALMRVVGRLASMHMGACQFCERDMFDSLGGYDETIYMGEDVDFVWRLRTAARRRGLTTALVRDLHVTTSSRRFDGWPLWRILLMTHPLVVFGLRRRKSPWRDWYDPSTAPR